MSDKREMTVVIEYEKGQVVSVPGFLEGCLGGKVIGVSLHNEMTLRDIAERALLELDHEPTAADALAAMEAIVCEQG